MKKNALIRGAAVLMAAVLLAGCGSSSSETQTEAAATAAETEAAAEAETEAETEAEVEKPAAGGDTYECDVLIVGSGATGLSAAMEASDAGASVIVLEKMSYIGGNSNRASGGVNAAGTDLQRESGIEDTPEQFYEDIIRVGKDNDPDLLTYFVNHGQDVIDFCEDIGIEFSPTINVQYNDVPRSHRDAENRSIGEVLIPLLEKQIEDRNIEVVYNTRATSLIQNSDGEVTGVTAEGPNGEEMTFEAGAVILASGGYEWNKDLLEEFAPEAINYTTSSHAGATGDGIVMGRDIGAALTHMDALSVIPLEQTTGTAVAVTLRRNGMIYVNSDGERFVDENSDSAGSLIRQDPAGYVWYIFNDECREVSPTADEYISMGICTEADTIPELAEAIGVDPDTLQDTMDKWSQACESGIDEEFGRSVNMDINIAAVGPYYAIKVAPGIHYTCGGLVINVDTEVLDEDGNAIAGLYAAGETTGGLHGSSRYTGNSVPDTLIFGRQAGTNAAGYALAKGHVDADTVNESSGAAQAQGDYKDGTYTAKAAGLNGDVVMTVEIEGGNIVSLTSENVETEAIFEGVERDLYPEILAKQTVDGIDTITGATYASTAVLEAVGECLEEASN